MLSRKKAPPKCPSFLASTVSFGACHSYIDSPKLFVFGITLSATRRKQAQFRMIAPNTLGLNGRHKADRTLKIVVHCSIGLHWRKEWTSKAGRRRKINKINIDLMENSNFKTLVLT